MSVFPNHLYFYIRDREFGPAFIKTVAYAPTRTPALVPGRGNSTLRRKGHLSQALGSAEEQLQATSSKASLRTS